MNSWTVAQAKAKLSEVLDLALLNAPQLITRNGKRTAVIVSIRDWETRIARSENLVDFFAQSPLRGCGLDVKRVPDMPRPLAL